MLSLMFVESPRPIIPVTMPTIRTRPEWLSKYEDQFDISEGSDSSEETCVEFEEESSAAPTTPANVSGRENTPSKRQRTSKTIMLNNKSCRARLIVE